MGNLTMDERIQHRMRKKALGLRLPPLKVVVMSATLQVETFKSFFSDCATIQIPGRTFPVQIVYTRDPQEVSEWSCRQTTSTARFTNCVIFPLPRTTSTPPYPQHYKYTRRAMREIFLYSYRGS